MSKDNIVQLDLPADNCQSVVTGIKVAKAFDGRIGLRFYEDEKWQEYVLDNSEACELLNALQGLVSR